MTVVGCPCGYEVKPGLSDLVAVDQTIIDAAIAAFPAAQLAVWLDPILGRYLHAATLCLMPPPDVITPTIEWYTEPWAHLDDILNNVFAANWNLWCQCQPCPPITGCTGSNWIEIGSREGELNDAYYQDYRYLIPGGQTIYVQRMDTNVCFGPFTGLSKDTCLDAPHCGGKTVHFSNANGSGTVAAVNHEAVEPLFRLYFGAGSGGVAGPPFPILPVTVDPQPVAPVCDPTNICTAIQPLADQLEIIRLVVNQLAGGQLGLAGDYTFHIPGVTGPISGSLNETLTRALAAIAPIAPEQLDSPVTTALTEPSLVDLAGVAYIRVALTTVPDYMVTRGTGDSQIFYSRASTPGPGWVVLMGQDGAIADGRLAYPSGIEMVIPPIATGLAIHIEPGVEIEVTTYGRVIPA